MTGLSDQAFFRVETSQTVFYIFLFTLSLFFSMTLCVINLYKSYKIATKQQVIFQQASISLKRDSWKPDLLLDIGVPLPSSKKQQ